KVEKGREGVREGKRRRDKLFSLLTLPILSPLPSRALLPTVCEEMARKCLICQAGITQIHMGIDACRACAVFYRRARRSKCKFRCKSSTGKCVEE
ncbi:hypothetical protein PENTCL1PPCAC_4756, partial [Pristionchus entomophagus]